MSREDRLAEGLREKVEAKTLVTWVKQHRRYFDYSDTAQSLLEEKKDDDLLLIQDAFTNWIQKSKNDAQKQELTSLFLGVFRVQSYCSNLETICKAAVAKVVEVEKRFADFKSQSKSESLEYEKEIIKLKLEVKTLKQELEFVSK